MIERIDPRDIPGRATAYNSMVEADIREFMDSDWAVAEVKTNKYKTAGSAAVSYRAAIKRLDAGCIATLRGERLFLIRK